MSVRYVTIRYTLEPANGLPEDVTQMHVTDETDLDGSSVPSTYFVTGAQMDAKPTGSPHSYRALAKRALADIRQRPKFAPKVVVQPKPVQPTADGFTVDGATSPAP